MKSSMSYQPLSNEELEGQVKSAKTRMEPTPYCVTDTVIVQMWDMIQSYRSEIEDLHYELKESGAWLN